MSLYTGMLQVVEMLRQGKTEKECIEYLVGLGMSEVEAKKMVAKFAEQVRQEKS